MFFGLVTRLHDMKIPQLKSIKYEKRRKVN